ncbi:hypothetical protein WA158_004776 [Blastocystis sp. Blastoise]
MDNFMKIVKTQKRRILQQVKVVAKQTEGSSDAEFETAHAQFNELEKNLETFAKQSNVLINTIEAWADVNRKTADEIKKFDTTALQDDFDQASFHDASIALADVAQRQYDEVRRAVATVIRSRISLRIDKMLKEEFAPLKPLIKQRKNIVIDHDAHKEKVVQLDKKGDTGKADKFRRKLEHDEQQLKNFTDYLLYRFGVLNAQGFTILKNETVTLLAAQLFITKSFYDGLNSIANQFPGGDFGEVTNDFVNVLNKIRDGEIVETSYVAPILELPEFEPMAAPVYEEFIDTNVPAPTAVNAPVEYRSVPPPPPSRPAAPGAEYVVCLYDHDSEDAGELSFREGDRIEVLSKDPSGWWTGRLNGAEGLFPFNYTQAC